MTVTFYPIDTDKNEMDRNIIHYVSLLHPGYGLVGSPITTSVKIIKNEEGCRDDTVPKTVETRRHCEED